MPVQVVAGVQGVRELLSALLQLPRYLVRGRYFLLVSEVDDRIDNEELYEVAYKELHEVDYR